MFDCISKMPVWKTAEDKKYYLNQKGNMVGYCTSTEVIYNIHPSKQSRKSDETGEALENYELEIKTDADTDLQDEEVIDSNFHFANNPRVIGDSEFAQLLRKRANLLLSQTIAVMQFYKDYFPDSDILPKPPSRSSLSRTSRSVTAQISQNVQLNSCNQTLYFDMKQYDKLYGQKREMICVCIDNQLVEFCELKNKKALTIAECLIPIIEKNNINRIVSDTEPTNTGIKNGVIAIINTRVPDIFFEPCRLNVLDLVLKHEMQSFLGKVKTTSPQIPYDFVKKLQENWNYFRNKYVEVEKSPASAFPDLPNNEDRRDDYRLLLELCKVVRTLKETGDKRYVKIPRFPVNISSARWNSKAIYSLLAELVLESNDENLLGLNRFIIYQWAPVWFGVRHVADWGKLNNLSKSANNVLEKNRLINKVEMDAPTNEFAERIFRMANEKISRCHSVESLRNALIRYVNYTRKLN